MNCCKCCVKKMLSSFQINGIQAQSKGNVSKLMDDGEIVPFDTVVSSTTSSIIMNPDGSFTVLKSGNYNVDYYVSTDGTESKPSVTFSVNGIAANDPEVTTQINGFSLLKLNSGDTIKVLNANGEKVRIANLPIQADIRIFYLGF